MHNVSHKVEGGKLVITVDISSTAIDAAPPSASGKTYLVGTTGGALPVPSPKGAAISFALNVMVKK